MSEAENKVMTARALAREFQAIYRDALFEQISDVDLATLLIDGNFFAIRDPADQELFFATSNYLDIFLAAAVPPTVSFNVERLEIWAKEALEFSRQNIRHDKFSDIFSSRLQYETILQGLLVFDKQGAFLLDYFRQLRIDSVYLAESLPAPFMAATQNAAREAVHTALVSLSHYLIAHGKIGRPKAQPGIRSVKRTPSFLNNRGTIPFSEDAGKFRIDSSSELDQVAQYQPVVDRAIRKLVEARIIQRIGNKDKLLAGLLSEYRDEIARSVRRIRVPVLWSIGIEIESRIQAQDIVSDRDERLDEEDLFDLRRLMVSHNLYLNCFEQAASLLKDIESSAAIYQRIGAAGRHLPGMVLRRILEEDTLLEPETASAIGRAVSAGPSDGVESKGVVALRLGLLRGFLHAASGHLLSGLEKIVEKTLVDASAKTLTELLRADLSFAGVIAFLSQQSVALTKLSEQAPVYFGYVKELMKLIGIL